MAISGNSSYIPTAQEFVAHWNSAGAALGALGPVTLPGKPLGSATDVTASTLDALRGQLAAKATMIQSLVNATDLVRADLASAQAEALEYVVRFNAKVRGSLGGTRWVAALPEAPTMGSAQSNFCDPLDDAVDLWGRINVAEAMGTGKELELVNNSVEPPVAYPVADFTALVVLVKETWSALGRAEMDLKLGRGSRDEVQDKVHAILKAYRQVLPTFFRADSAIGKSLPRLTPVPGSTPDPATLSGAWNAATAKADLSAVVPEQTGLKSLRLLYSPGSSWSEDDASVVESRSLEEADLSQPVVFHTDYALANAGDRALFRVVVVNETDNEASSNVVEMVRT